MKNVNMRNEKQVVMLLNECINEISAKYKEFEKIDPQVAIQNGFDKEEFLTALEFRVKVAKLAIEDLEKISMPDTMGDMEELEE